MSALLAPLLALPDEPARRHYLEHCLDVQIEGIDDATSNALADALKAQADHFLRAEIQTSFQFAHLLIYWGELTHNDFHRALGLRAEANALSIGLGRYREALDKYNEAAAIYRAHGRPLDEAKAQIGKVWPLAALGQYDEALQCGEHIAHVLEAHQDWRQLATITMNLGVIFGRLGQEARALAQFNRAIEAFERIGAAELYLALQNRAEILRNLGQFDLSIESSLRAHAGFVAHAQPVEAARSQNNLAITYFMLGRYNEALQLLDAASQTYASDGRMRDVAEAKLFKSDCLLQLRRFGPALEACQAAREQFAEYGTHFEVAQAFANEALAHIGLGKSNEAVAALAQARKLFMAEGNAVWVATVDVELAGVLLRQGNARAACTIALNCARTFRLHGQSIRQMQAKLLAAQAAFTLCTPGDPPRPSRHGQHGHDRAQRYADEVLAFSQDKDIPWLTHGARVLQGQMAQARGETHIALNAYDHAIAQVERLRGRMMVEYRAEYLADKQSVYEQAVALCLDANQPAAALTYAERAKSRSLLDLLAFRLDLGVRARNPSDESLVQALTDLRTERDQLVRRAEGQRLESRNSLEPPGGDQSKLRDSAARLAELEKEITERWHTLLVRNADYAREADLSQVRTPSVQRDLQHDLAPDETLIEYFFVQRQGLNQGQDQDHGPNHQDQLIAFVASADQVTAHRLPMTLAQLQTLVRNLWLNLKTVPESPPSRTASLARNAQQMLRRLHEAVFAPLNIPPNRRLIVVPHGPLHYVPFHALHAGDHSLIERHEISYLPSASVLAYCRQPARVQSATHSPEHCIATFGFSRGGQLPQTVVEARAIAEMWQGWHNQHSPQGAWDSRAYVESEATLDTLREVAPHSRILHLAMHGDYRADNPLFSGLLFADGSLTTLDTFNLRLQASLVTLSACQTGRNVVSGGDELLGLMRGFLGAGAASLVLSLWRAEDNATARLMRILYTQLRAGQTKAAALRAAQCEMLQDQAHPYFWAPFLLVGDTGAL